MHKILWEKSNTVEAVIMMIHCGDKKKYPDKTTRCCEFVRRDRNLKGKSRMDSVAILLFLFEVFLYGYLCRVVFRSEPVILDDFLSGTDCNLFTIRVK